MLINIFRYEEDGSYVAHPHNHPTISAVMDTPEEALAELIQVLRVMEKEYFPEEDHEFLEHLSP